LSLTVFAERLAFVISREKSLHAFSKKASVPDSTIRSYLKGVLPSIDNLVQMAEAADVSVDWLVGGSGPMKVDPNQVFAPEKSVLPGDFALIPRLDIQAAAGNGLLNHTEDTVGFLAFQTAWLARKGLNPEFARVLTAKGDSMEPTIRDGDVLLVDTSIDSLVDHGIYVLVYAGLLLVKRVSKRLDGSVLIRSDNRDAYDDEIVGASSTPELIIAGRVMWFGRTM
jgi:phage repressor protein C with HTH and peptisase S24 domain